MKELDINIFEELHKYGILIYKKSGKILSSEEISVNNETLHGFSSEGYYQLEKLVLTKEVKEVVWNGLGRYSFNSFEVDPGSPIFQELNGVLYTKKGYDRHGDTRRKKMIELVACPTNVISHNVMHGTIRIANCAFKESRISNIIFPSTLEEIGTNAFYFADNLKSIEIPQSIRKIESQIVRSPFLIKYDDHQFESWENLFSYMVENGYEKKDNKIEIKK